MAGLVSKHLVITEGGHKLLWFDPLQDFVDRGETYLVITTRGQYVSFKKPGREFKIIEVKR